MRIAKRKLEDQDHLVVPVVMLRAGVHSGSYGPIYYPAAELQRSVPHWNGRPVVVYHPGLYANAFAAQPEVFSKQKVGVIFNTSFDGNRLTAEAWLNPERLQRVDSRVLQALSVGRPIEVSTGLVLDEDGMEGVHNGRQYVATATDYRPDHLAILPDKVGACSLQDGCGLAVNEFSKVCHALAPA